MPSHATPLQAVTNRDAGAPGVNVNQGAELQTFVSQTRPRTIETGVHEMPKEQRIPGQSLFIEPDSRSIVLGRERPSTLSLIEHENHAREIANIQVRPPAGDSSILPLYAQRNPADVAGIL